MKASKRKAKYQRRKQARLEKRQEKLSQYDDFERFASTASLIEATMLAQKGVAWKPVVQRYMANLCYNSEKTHRELEQNKDIRKGFNEFDICERGKTRHIQSLKFSERVVHKSYTINALYPIFTNSLILDNYASQKGKGTDLALRRMKQFLQEHYRKYGREGAILLVDLSDYFGSINHDVLYEIYEKEFTDERLITYGKMFIDAYAKGIGLGSETSQVDAIKYADRIDHLIKDKLGIRAYGRYMDDSFIIHHDVEYLKELLDLLKSEYAKIGITLNQRKTKICDLKHGFTWLKNKFYLTNTGKVIIKPERKTITRERRRLRKQADILCGEDMRASYYSWRGSVCGMGDNCIKKNTYNTVTLMDNFYAQMYNKCIGER